MQRIQYTQKQIEQLLEMCKVLFPEYKNYHVNGAFLYLNKGKIPLDAIPIFEFCMTYLASKLLVMYDFTIYQTTGNFMYIHPVDYLYEQFLKLK